MPRSKKADPVRAVIQNLGHQIGAELAQAIVASFEASFDPKSLKASGGGARRGRPATGGKPCKVPHCGRRSAAKGMCQNHYAKARRLKLNVDSLSNSDLQTLAADLRGK